jgi:hypothetical protein
LSFLASAGSGERRGGLSGCRIVGHAGQGDLGCGRDGRNDRGTALTKFGRSSPSRPTLRSRSITSVTGRTAVSRVQSRTYHTHLAHGKLHQSIKWPKNASKFEVSLGHRQGRADDAPRADVSSTP